MMLNIGTRLNALGAMTACGLAPSLTREYAIEQLTTCCEAVEKSGVDRPLLALVPHSVFQFEGGRDVG